MLHLFGALLRLIAPKQHFVAIDTISHQDDLKASAKLATVYQESRSEFF
jgi:hypothetical protein